MPSNQLTPARLRELIAAATPGPFSLIDGDIYRQEDGSCIVQPIGPEWLQNSLLIAFLLNNAPALADALKAQRLLEELMGHILSVRRDNTDEWMEGLVEALNETEAAIGGKDRCEYRRCDGVIRIIRAAKEAADAKQ